MNDIEHTLHDAFGRRNVPGDARPSLIDVKVRARRRHRRRTAGGMTALALTGVGGIALVAHRAPATTALQPADDGGGVTASTLCVDPVPTTVPATTVAGELLGTTTTTTMSTPPPCSPAGAWRCTGPGVGGADGYTYYEWCEQTGMASTTTTTAPGQVAPTWFGTTTTGMVPETWPAVSSSTSTTTTTNTTSVGG